MKKSKKIAKVLLTSKIKYGNIYLVNAASPSGKATDSDSVIS